MGPNTTPVTEYFANAAFGVGLVPTLLGLNALLRPASALALLQFSAPPQPEGQRLTRSLMQIYGARNLSIGLMAFAVWSQGDRRTLGLTAFALTPIAIIDGFVSKAQIGRGEWSHWIFVPIGLVLGAGCLGLFEG